ncbi:hypothetical protein GCM10009096_14840 [Parasphingorhabdus litoris]|uniref:Uncharacterized protein n=2 Tax=Parasphingorhabdus litoris TaxID=394733 RepID=A0ABN1AE76_9SPHN
MSGNNVSARTPAKDKPVADESEKESSRGRSERSSASGKAEQLPGRMWVIAGAGLTIWIIIAIAVIILFF